ncbi:MAG: hypothetical protein FWH44_06105 [Methanomassiliicoccaceae archaeon]|nr:hypothetical protein [Methanomassiliicoccaceae archaeon]
MRKDTRNTAIALVAVLAVFGAAYVGVILYSGSSQPFYTVESGSMMHSGNSKVGIIDTGDMVIVRDPSKVNIVTYVEGHETGYGKFGDFGDVVIYERAGSTPVIHRAILYLESNGDGTWNAPGLEHYSGEWSYFSGGVTYEDNGATDTRDPGSVKGALTFKNFGYKGETFSVDLNTITYTGGPEKGYITKGDNNPVTDGLLVPEERIVAIAAKEIPWLGCIKLFVTGSNTDRIPTNSVILLIIALAMIPAAIIGANFLYKTIKKEKE